MRSLQKKLCKTVRHPYNPEKCFALSSEEQAFSENPKKNTVFPLRIPLFYHNLIQHDSTGALRKMAVPRVEELNTLAYETPDPLNEEPYETVGRCIHRYPDRVLLLLTDQCAMFCRHCFRRRFTGEGSGFLSTEDLGAITQYLNDNPEVHEVILSGGDPLMLSNGKLAAVFRSLKTGKAATGYTAFQPGAGSPAVADYQQAYSSVKECSLFLAGASWLIIPGSFPGSFAEWRQSFHRQGYPW